jgi:hypothetical protein
MTYDDLVCVPCFVLLQLLAFHETRNAEIDLIAFLMGTLYSYAVRDIDMAYLSAMFCPSSTGAYMRHRYT